MERATVTPVPSSRTANRRHAPGRDSAPRRPKGTEHGQEQGGRKTRCTTPRARRLLPPKRQAQCTSAWTATGSCESRNNHRYAVVVQDLATQWIQSYPRTTKTSQETEKSLQKFLESDRKPKVIYSDKSTEFGKTCEDLSWNHCTSTPHRSETNGICERERYAGLKTGLLLYRLQSGLDEKWWADSMECKTYLRNIQDLLSDGKTPYERRLGELFKGPIIPFGSMVEYHPITAKDQSRIHQFGKKVLPGPRIRSVRGVEFGMVTY